jgi:hypothetical protein
MNTSQIKRTDPNYIFSTISKSLNSLNEPSSNKKDKKEHIDYLYKYITSEPKFSRMVVQEILITFNKNLIKLALFDSIDLVRESSLKILIQ